MLWSILGLRKFRWSFTHTFLEGTKTFDCNNDMINTFVKKSLKKRVRKHLSQAYVLLDTQNSDEFVGFYTLDTFSITRDSFEDIDKPSGLPPVVPVVKLGMLGVSKHLQGQGIGKRVLRDAMLKTVQISDLAGCRGIYLLAEKDAILFYSSLGFVALKSSEPVPMFLDIEVIVDLVV